MAKLVDAIGLGPIGRNAVLVRVQSVAPLNGSSLNHSHLPPFFTHTCEDPQAIRPLRSRGANALRAHGWIHDVQCLELLEGFHLDPLTSPTPSAPYRQPLIVSAIPSARYRQHDTLMTKGAPGACTPIGCLHPCVRGASGF